jgi:parallel beta-helix repeat protein
MPQGEFSTRILKIIFIILTLLLSSFFFLGNVVDTIEAKPYPTLDQNLNWTMKDLVINSSGTVTGSGIVYIIHDMLTISKSDTLTILPGEIIKVNKDVRIDIKGKLICVGNATNPILFTSNVPSPKAGDWLTLRFNQANPQSVVQYTEIEYAYDGIYIYNCSPRIENNVIRNIIYRGIYCWDDNSYIFNNTIYNITNPNIKSLDEGTGIRAYISDSYIANNKIYQIQKYGVRLDYSESTVYNNNVTSSFYGIFIFRSEPRILNNFVWNNSNGIYMRENVFVNISGNNVVDNALIGIYFHRTSGDIHHNTIKSSGVGIINYQGYNTIVIRNNDIILNEVSGITLEFLKNVTIKNNYIWHNFYSPVYCKGVENIIIDNNTIRRNEDDGIELIDCKNVQLLNNVIDDNRGGNGILMSNIENVSMYENSIRNAGFHALKFESLNITHINNNEIISSQQKDIWLENAYVSAINLSFDMGRVRLNQNSILVLENYLNIKVIDNYLDPISGANVTVKDGSTLVYSGITDKFGEVNDLLLVDLSYNGKGSFDDNITTVEIEFEDFSFDNNPRIVNMSASHTEIFGRNNLPVIRITTPSSMDIISDKIFINGTVFDPDAYVESVDISIDDGVWKEAKAMKLYWAKWSYPWNSTDVSDGEHVITARVYDGLNYSTSSIKIIVKNQNDPEQPYMFVMIYSPYQNQEVRGEITILGTAQSDSAEIISVEVQINDDGFSMAIPEKRNITRINPDTGLIENIEVPDWGRWGFDWNTTGYTDGSHTITARATDELNNKAVEEIPVVVDNRGNDSAFASLEITHPTNSAIITGEVEISGKLWGFESETPKILMRFDDEEWFSPTKFQWYKWWLFNYIWDSTKTIDGIHQIFVKSGSGQDDLLDDVVVIVNNGGEDAAFGIKINSPEESTIINGTFSFEGYAWNYGETILGIQIRVDNHGWENIKEYHIMNTGDNLPPFENEEDNGQQANLFWAYWTHPLDTLPFKDGIHTISVKVFDSLNVKTDSITVIFVNLENITDYDPNNLDPKFQILDIMFTSPNNMAFVKDSIDIRGIAWARFGNIESVELQIDDLDYIPADSLSSDWTKWGYVWNTKIHKNGWHFINARVSAELQGEPITKTETIVVYVNNAVEGSGVHILSDIAVKILYPEENETISGTLEIFGIGWVSNNGTIDIIQIKVDEGLWLPANPTNDNWLTWNYTLDTLKYPNGAHNITARLNSGSVLVSSTVDFVINNTNPVIIPPDDKNDTDNNNKNGDKDPIPVQESDDLNSALINALLAAISVVIILLLIIFAFIFKTKYKKSEKSVIDERKELDKLDKDRSEPEQSEEDAEEKTDSGIIFEEEGDDVIVIRGEMVSAAPPAARKITRTKTPRPKKIQGRKPATKLTPVQLKGLQKTKPVGGKPPKKGKSRQVSKKDMPEKPKKKEHVKEPGDEEKVEKKISKAPVPVKKSKDKIAKPKEQKVVEEKVVVAEEISDLKDDTVQFAEVVDTEEKVPSAIPVISKEKSAKVEPKKGKGSLDGKLAALDKRLQEGKINKDLYEKLKNQYVEKNVEVKVGDKKGNSQDVKKKPPMNCSKCDEPPVYIKKYQAWYCTKCKDYVVREVAKN